MLAYKFYSWYHFDITGILGMSWKSEIKSEIKISSMNFKNYFFILFISMKIGSKMIFGRSGLFPGDAERISEVSFKWGKKFFCRPGFSVLLKIYFASFRGSTFMLAYKFSAW